MDSNFWFYTLSAIPQTLGAIIALTATFVIFKLNHIEERTKREYDEVKDWVSTILWELKIHDLTKFDDNAMLDKLNEAIARLDPEKEKFGLEDARFRQLNAVYEHVLISLQRKIDSYKNIYDYLLEKRRILSSLIEVRRSALFRLKISLGLTALLIAISIVLLPFYNLLSSCGYFIVGTLAIFSSVAVLYTAVSVWDIAKRNLR
ncbi:MAG TPA: hypothetical protein PK609_03170 [Candidatus Paceibacterota bacterium]|nr:hypothetical protein [Candidatus Paceibacterota bacterium]